MHSTYQRITGNDTLVLCVHGIQGSPSQFSYLTDRLPADVDFLCPILPGHGGSVSEFARADSSEWLRFLREMLSDLVLRYKRIVYVGHSMGCLLGILAAAEGIAEFSGMLLLACPLALRPTVRYALNNWRAVTQKNPSSPWVQAAKDANSVSCRSPFAYLICIKPYLGLFRLMIMAKRTLAPLKAPVIALHSDGDEIVSRKSLSILSTRAHADTALVPDSGHFLYSSAARQIILQRLLSLLGE